MLRDYQLEISRKASVILKDLKIVCIFMEVRTGKTLTALETAKISNAKNVLFLTKKKAIKSIKDDYTNFGYVNDFKITVTNNESMHKVELQKFDLVIHDESHRFGSFPKPSAGAKVFKSKFGKLPLIMLSGTPTPESFSQIYHQFWISQNSPFKQWSSFYKWAKDFVNVTEKNLGYAIVKDYSEANELKIRKYIDNYIISFTQKEAGFSTSVKETILHCEMSETTKFLIKELCKNKVIEGKDEVILADTAVKLMQKVHQLSSGTVKFESGNSKIIDLSKAEFIFNKFQGKKIGIFYKFKAELSAIKQIYGDSLTTDLDEFNQTNKSIALQIVSGREGISLKLAENLVFYNIDFSATSYFQALDRLTTMERLSNEVFWIFSKGGIENKIYQSVRNKENYTSNYFKKDYK